MTNLQIIRSNFIVFPRKLLVSSDQDNSLPSASNQFKDDQRLLTGITCYQVDGRSGQVRSGHYFASGHDVGKKK